MRISKRKIQIIMSEKLLRQKEVVDSAGISRQTLSSVINGRNCSPLIAGKIAKALGVEVTEILENEKE